MQCLAPLPVSLFVAMSTVFGRGKSAGLDKLVVHGGRIARQRNVVLAEKKIVGLACFGRVVLVA